MAPIARENLERLGLKTSDLLAQQRGYILVEGSHDVVMLEAMMGEALRHLQVEVLALRGIKYLSAASIRFLYDYTSAHIFLMLDNLRTAELAGVWQRALDLVAMNDPAGAVQCLERADCLSDGSEEARKMMEVLRAEIDTGQSDRLTPHGLGRADIIEYLPVSEVVGGAYTWEQLRADHQAAVAAKRGAAKDFKQWLRIQHGADTSTEAVQAAASRVDELPADLARLLKTVEARVSNAPGPTDLSSL